MVKRLMEEIEARGADFIRDKYVCAGCLGDYALKEIVCNDATKWKCDYCGKRRLSASVDEIVEVVVRGLRMEYEDPVENVLFDSAEGGYQMNCSTTDDLLWDEEVTENEELFDDIARAIKCDQWVQKDPYGLPWDKR